MAKRVTKTATANGAHGGSDDASAAVREVTFRIPAGDAQSAALVGEFNDWSPDATPMERSDDSFQVTIPLAPGRYRYRFVLDGERWENDWQADEYVPNEYGSDDSVRQV